ncbi:hypothetical protein A3F07_01585 [candidate division WWE3 bacterium RIFCSPHIGHO2_12_FULL_38_15]|uniref:Transglutaminase-like domain-containing protein n=1 Tax=candidate division WWE3 bacterium RIFCSPHIGHO2_02_FULL_38_14 TaxID=1802620 RepID=A0A1F4V939_UNCKA|nr:MAG: hypothetical protein A2793_01715 [candidate division WWE3 bacterium RIFCSPHIGHO2_01_FULL_38_45]OGC48397.1 MAG: hypothetical protein A3F07_01585 [candidate division WWE3 bacterium RIFCSPHIGHO2_12_FULL_38_15]OGC53628.1 MAG: hypothetical protein A3D91_04270 [candidate division WWE3 bacterium RIFCSPHIGHO2_02_FULL_38_14]OGC54330.1 MAG: hypothetical protein A3B64_02380 [candidate division WWE3 bacterium RIFCSPLOWO2_01_FULL_37_24]HLB51575.1 hypothetical protein [Patescibacteria group bacterium
MFKDYYAVLSQKELTFIKKLNTPEKVQKYIDNEIEYDPYREDRSIREVLEDKKAECYNGALLAAACLLYHGYKASIIELLAREDEEHILCVYKSGNKFGSIAQSKFLGLKARNPMYMSVRDLVVTYMEFYFSFDGRYSLMSYTNLFPLGRYKFKWFTSGTLVAKMSEDLKNYKHYYLVNPDDPYYYVSKERFWREVLKVPKEIVIPKEYLPRPNMFK